MRITLSGGGTGGHILPNIALIHELRQRDQQLQLLYIGTRKGMERQMMKDLQVPYVGIAAGKLRRYFSWQNFLDFFKIPIGFFQALWALLRFRPQVIFCKGGYVCLPVAVAGRVLGIPVVLHESDVSPGLANRLSARFATTICVAFEESKRFFRGRSVVVTGNPVRRELAFGNQEEGLHITGFDRSRPIILIMGGSLGATFINDLVWRNLEALTTDFQIVHICGKHTSFAPKLSQKKSERYRSFDFVGSELKHLYAVADVIVARSGALTLAEIDFFEKPSLLIPLPRGSSRGDQIENAQAFARTHRCVVMPQEDFHLQNADQRWLKSVHELLKNSQKDHLLTSSQPSRSSGPKILASRNSLSDRAAKFVPLEKIVKILERTVQ